MNKKILYITSLLSIFIFTGVAYGASTADCQPIYGGAGACEQNSVVTITKQVKNPETNAFVENLTLNNAQYQPGETIIFKIMITNTSGGTIEKFEVRDFFPQYLTFVKGDGKYDQIKKILIITVDQLKSKESKTFMVEAKAAEKEKLPDDPQSRCVINQASVNANNKTSQDNTLVCIAKDGKGTSFETKGDVIPTFELKTAATTSKQQNQPQTTKGGLPIYKPQQTKTTPNTGPEAIAIPGLASLLGLGLYMRSKAKT